MASLTLLTGGPSASTQNTPFLLSGHSNINSNSNSGALLPGGSATKIAPKRECGGGATSTSSARSRRNRPASATSHSGGRSGGPSVARRNERERNRVRQVNLGFATLRQHVPNRSKKMSKVETLRSAVTYIRQLQQLLGGGEDEDENCCAVPGFAEAFAATMGRHSTGGATSASSPAPSLGSDDAGSSPYDNNSLGPEDEELMDFATWLS